MTLHTEINVCASPKRVWDALTNFSDYQHWNASIPYAEGDARAGAELQVIIQWPGLKKSPYKLRILRAEPERELRWLGQLVKPGIMDGNHSFLIEAAGDGYCKITQTEEFRGWMVPFFAPWLRRNVLSGFEQLNIALKKWVER